LRAWEKFRGFDCVLLVLMMEAQECKKSGLSTFLHPVLLINWGMIWRKLCYKLNRYLSRGCGKSRGSKFFAVQGFSRRPYSATTRFEAVLAQTSFELKLFPIGYSHKFDSVLDYVVGFTRIVGIYCLKLSARTDFGLCTTTGSPNQFDTSENIHIYNSF
jgi:hypothetical protein